MTTFGDAGEAWAAGSVPDAAQVARRLHELLAALDALDGYRTPAWEQLSTDMRAVATAIIAELLAWLEREGTWAPAT